MNRRIVIVGADVLGQMLAEAIELAATDELLGFVDDRAGETPLLGTVADLPSLLDGGATHVALGIGDNPTRRRVAEQAEEVGLRLATVVHPRAFVSPSATLEDGVFVDAVASVHGRSLVGGGTVLMPHVWIAHDVRIGAFCWASGHAAVGGFASIGDGCKLGVGSIVAAHATVRAETIVGAGDRFAADG